MAEFLHGVEVLNRQSVARPRPIRTLRSNVIGLVGTAGKGPINRPTLVRNRVEGVAFGAGLGTIPDALDGIFDQGGASVVVINVLDPDTHNVAVPLRDYTLVGGKVTLPGPYRITEEAVENAAGTSAVKDTDYTIDYDTGVLARQQARDIAETEYTLVAGDVTLPGPYPVSNVVVKNASGVLAAIVVDYTITLGTGALSRVGSSSIITADDSVILVSHSASASTVIASDDATIRVSYKVPNEDDSTLEAAIVGGVNATTGAYEGLHALLAAQGAVKVKPKIICAPGYSHETPVLVELPGILTRLRAIAVTSGPNSTDAAAVTLRDTVGSERVYMVDPHGLVYDTESLTNVAEDVTARAAGVIATKDSLFQGPWHSPSNTLINGLVGTGRPVDFGLSDPNSRANFLNENEISTIIQINGFRLWGNRGLNGQGNDPKFNFINVVRTSDAIAEAIEEAHLWAVDRCVDREYVEAVTGSVQAYLDTLAAPSRPGGRAILGGSCWADPALNLPTQVADGHVVFSYDFTPCYPAERVTFHAEIVNNYLEGVF